MKPCHARRLLSWQHFPASPCLSAFPYDGRPDTPLLQVHAHQAGEACCLPSGSQGHGLGPPDRAAHDSLRTQTPCKIAPTPSAHPPPSPPSHSPPTLNPKPAWGHRLQVSVGVLEQGPMRFAGDEPPIVVPSQKARLKVVRFLNRLLGLVRRVCVCVWVGGGGGGGLCRSAFDVP